MPGLNSRRKYGTNYVRLGLRFFVRARTSVDRLGYVSADANIRPADDGYAIVPMTADILDAIGVGDRTRAAVHGQQVGPPPPRIPFSLKIERGSHRATFCRTEPGEAAIALTLRSVRLGLERLYRLTAIVFIGPISGA